MAALAAAQAAGAAAGWGCSMGAAGLKPAPQLSSGTAAAAHRRAASTPLPFCHPAAPPPPHLPPDRPRRPAPCPAPCPAAASREQMAYNIDCTKASIPEALEVLADAVLNPKFQSWEVAEQVRGRGWAGLATGLGWHRVHGWWRAVGETFKLQAPPQAAAQDGGRPEDPERRQPCTSRFLPSKCSHFQPAPVPLCSCARWRATWAT